MAGTKDRKNMMNRVFRTGFAVSAILIISTMIAIAEEPDEQKTERSLSAEGAVLVVVQSANGDVTLSSWEKPEVVLRFHKRVIGDTDEEAEEHLARVEVTMQQVEDRIEIATEQPPDIPVEIAVDLDISVPEDMSLNVNALKGSVYITGNRGKESITTGDGDIELRDVVGSVSAKTTNGNIYAEIRFDAKSSFITTNGSIDIRIEDEFSVPIFAQTTSGSIDIDIPAGFSADLDAVVKSGRVICEASLDGSIEEGSLRGRIFGGGPLMRLRTMSGDITIKAPEDLAEEIPEPEQEPEEAETEERPSEPEIPYAEIVKTLDPPVIDGKLDDECWQQAGRIEHFVWANGIENPHEPTEAYLLWDDQNFYVGIKCYESRMDMVRISNTEDDNEAWEDDMVQIFIDTTPDTETDYYHIAVNSVGTVFDQEIVRAEPRKQKIERSKNGVKWNSGGVFRTEIRSDFWSVEASIPFSALKVEPGEGDVWRFNLYRMEQRRAEYTYWSPTYVSERWPHVPSRFGELIFAGGLPVAEVLA